MLAEFSMQVPTAVQAQNAHSWKNEGDRVRHVVRDGLQIQDVPTRSAVLDGSCWIA